MTGLNFAAYEVHVIYHAYHLLLKVETVSVRNVTSPVPRTTTLYTLMVDLKLRFVSKVYYSHFHQSFSSL